MLRFLFVLLLVTGDFLIQTTAAIAGLSEADPLYLKRIEKATFSGFSKLFDPATHLPVDIASVAKGDVLRLPSNTDFSKTSPTNIGLAFLYLILARDRSILTQTQAYAHGLRMMTLLEKMETHEGFFYNWYYLSAQKGKIPQVVLNRFVSSLDNGDMDICLMASAGAFPGTVLSEKIERFLAKKNYHYFFNKNPTQHQSEMLNVGYDQIQETFAGVDYGIFNTEARLAAFVAILKDGVPASVWKKQARLLRHYSTLENEKIPVVAPWGGSLYEVLFADEILGGAQIAPRAFRTNALNMIRIHRDKGLRLSKTAIWGLSNGEVPGENRYEMAGVSEIAYNQFPGTFVTIYSSFLSLRYNSTAVLGNLRRMEALNPRVFNPHYGFTDSMDPSTGVINENILSLDKGMEVLALGNFMNTLEGKPEISDYLWAYLKSKGWEAQGKTMLIEEEQHPSYLALLNTKNPGATSLSLLEVAPIDLFEERQDLGAFFEPGRASASIKLDRSHPTMPVIEIQYDVRQRYSYAGIFLTFDDLKITQSRQLNFQIRGAKADRHPKTIKAELKYRGNYVQFEHVPLTSVWQRVEIEVPKDKKIDELAFVIENATSLKQPRGQVFIKDLRLK